jgi:hypothetical protein
MRQPGKFVIGFLMIALFYTNAFIFPIASQPDGSNCVGLRPAASGTRTLLDIPSELLL